MIISYRQGWDRQTKPRYHDDTTTFINNTRIQKKKTKICGLSFFYLSTVYSRWSSVGQARRDCRRWPEMQRFRNEIWNWKAKCKPVVEWSRDFVELVWV